METMKTEYVIWGKTSEDSEKQLLIVNLFDKPITNKRVAEATRELLECKYKCHDVRVQELSLDEDLSQAFLN